MPECRFYGDSMIAMNMNSISSPIDIGRLRAALADGERALGEIREFLNIAEKTRRLEQVERVLKSPEVWNDMEQFRSLGRERARLADVVEEVGRLTTRHAESVELLAISIGEEDEDMLVAVAEEVAEITACIEDLNTRRLFDDEHDPGDCFLTVQAGSGGTEAQDWASMLFRMYLRYAERNDYKTETLEEAGGEVAGLKSAAIKIVGSYAYGHLRLESGIHRLVRKSPFDSNHRRHTSFASVFVFPVVDETIAVEINLAELRIDTYRASGAGGQHVNTTNSAVRITHEPTGIVVQCQNDRSQHKNRAEAMSMLRARLYKHELELHNSEKNKIEQSKDEITWGRQIRSYVLDQSRIKDLRSGYESGNPRAILDGDLEGFIRANLLHQDNA
ncbi:MAG: peptide chain release factor 2 [Candidatus Zeuxoniibacter abyssi]|nr:MAG: peptide chain release factor 2 [Candidatus Persebacteraceae bacterium AB1(2)]